MLTEVITINKGFQIVERKYTVDAGFAAKVLSSSKQFKYTQAEYKQATDTVELIRHICICGNCGFQMPSYHSFYHDYEPPRKLVTKKFAAEWCGDIRSLFDNEDKVLPLYNPYIPVKFFCPECGYESVASHKTDTVTFEQNKHTVRVKCTIDTIKDIIDIEWAPTLEIVSLPLVESIVFNFKKGKVHFELHTPEGFLMCVRDVSSGISVEKQTSKLIRLINNNSYVKHKLIKYFNKMWGMRIPFTANEIDLHKFILMTNFIGYNDKSFYHNIPSDEYDFTIDPLFKKARKKLHYSDNCIELLNKSNLPKSKTIKKALFTQPAFFFYLTELEMLWKLFGEDHNLLFRFLQSKNAFANLFMMHTYPSVLEFYNDFVCEKGFYDFHKLITFFDKKACKYGIYYSAFSKAKKRLERKTWNDRTSILKSGYQCLGIDININNLFVTDTDEHSEETEIKDQTHNGYMFSVLKTRNQFLLAGEQLRNCLKNSQFTNYVIGVMKNGHYVAAIEVDLRYNTVVQALICDNEEIEADKTVFMAFKKWCKVNNICYNKSEFPDVEVF